MYTLFIIFFLVNPNGGAAAISTTTRQYKSLDVCVDRSKPVSLWKRDVDFSRFHGEIAVTTFCVPDD
jgi:hypothetical protein